MDEEAYFCKECGFPWAFGHVPVETLDPDTLVRRICPECATKSLPVFLEIGFITKPLPPKN